LRLELSDPKVKTESVNRKSTNVFVRDVDLAERYRVDRTAIWRWARKGDFPAPVRLSPGCTRWRFSDVVDWENLKYPNNTTPNSSNSIGTSRNKKYS